MKFRYISEHGLKAAAIFIATCLLPLSKLNLMFNWTLDKCHVATLCHLLSVLVLGQRLMQWMSCLNHWHHILTTAQLPLVSTSSLPGQYPFGWMGVLTTDRLHASWEASLSQQTQRELASVCLSLRYSKPPPQVPALVWKAEKHRNTNTPPEKTPGRLLVRRVAVFTGEEYSAEKETFVPWLLCGITMKRCIFHILMNARAS